VAENEGVAGAEGMGGTGEGIGIGVDIDLALLRIFLIKAENSSINFE
jgi:hypothetical protein